MIMVKGSIINEQLVYVQFWNISLNCCQDGRM